MGRPGTYRQTIIRPIWPLRLLRLAHWRLEVNEAGVIHAGKQRSWHDLRAACLEEGRLSAALVVPGPNGFSLDGFPKRKARRLMSLCDLAMRVDIAGAKIAECLASATFVSDNNRQSILAHIVKNICPPGWDSGRRYLKMARELEPRYSVVKGFINDSRAMVAEANSSFVDDELKEWAGWLAKVEKAPLTDEQARAVIVMEDRNLLVAAAGSGKTSTIVAKAAYAVAKGYCKPGELLILTFNRAVREELSERVRDRLTAIGLSAEIVIETFNSFGFRQMRRLSRSARLAPWADNQARELAHLSSLVSGLAKADAQFAAALAEFSAVWLESDEKEEGEIAGAAGAGSLEEALRRLSARATPKNAVPTYLTLNGETVRSLQELRICNWLALMGVAYQYERPFDQALLPTDWSSGYRPDFYYPGIDCWHEHFGINKLGKAPPWMSRRGGKRQRTYEDEVVGKRQVLGKSGVDWFETRSADFYDGSWKEKLARELKRRGLSFAFIGWSGSKMRSRLMNT